ncbi:major histocompatibility complex class I-related gene protein-like isoform X2 [Hyperolius riggenbachi]
MRRVPWFKSTYATLLDASINQYLIQQNEQRLFQFFRNFQNDTNGFHYLQMLQGCIHYENNTIDTVFSYRYDGKPFLTFNVQTATWIAEIRAAQYFADVFNKNQTLAQKNKNILLNTCLPHITELLSLGNCTFNRREIPAVTVTQTCIKNSTCRLHCRAYGHYPKDINMTWYRNGQQISEDLIDRVTLPFPDITYLTWLSFNITPSPDDLYSCSVTHSSLMIPLSKHLKISVESHDLNRHISSGATAAICLAVVLMVTLTVFGALLLAKRRRQ